MQGEYQGKPRRVFSDYYGLLGSYENISSEHFNLYHCISSEHFEVYTSICIILKLAGNGHRMVELKRGTFLVLEDI